MVAVYFAYDILEEVILSETIMFKKSTSTDITSTKYLVVVISDDRYGFDLTHIKEITRMPEITPMPDMDDGIRGIIRLRESILPLIDLRVKLGYSALDAEQNDFIEMLKAREQDHINWLNELKKSVEERLPFKLTLDPHSCAFGKWYDTYKSNNAAVSHLLEQFDKPHKDIHAVGHQVAEKIKVKDFNAALEICNLAENRELKRLKTLFSELYDTVIKQNNEFAVIFDHGKTRLAVSVDKIYKIVEVESKYIESAENQHEHSAVRGICNKNDLFFVLLDETAFSKMHLNEINNILKQE